jgi:hypothetical protein
MSCLNHIWYYMLGVTTLVQLMKNLVVVVISDFFINSKLKLKIEVFQIVI